MHGHKYTHRHTDTRTCEYHYSHINTERARNPDPYHDEDFGGAFLFVMLEQFRLLFLKTTNEMKTSGKEREREREKVTPAW